MLPGFFSFSLNSDSRTGIDLYNGEIVVDGLQDYVIVYRDQRGMPHIYASNEHDLYFASGFVTARERLWQMDLIRRSCSGRLAEIFGKKFVETDKFFRCLGISDKSKKVIENEDPEIRQYLQDYTDGVNFYILKAGKKLPPEFRILRYEPDPWRLEDIAGIIGIIGWSLADHNLDIELFCNKVLDTLGYETSAGLIPDDSKTENVVHPGFTTTRRTLEDVYSFVVTGKKLAGLGLNGFSASNNWAVSGKKSVTGKPLFSNDMHLTINSPGVWMQMHQVVPGKLNVTGVLFAGEPFIVAGHNEKIAWGMTNMFVDAIDLYREKINPENSGQYFFNGSWREIAVRKESIIIKGGSIDTFNIKSTHRGPIISGLKNAGQESVSMRWSGLDESNEIKAVFLLNNASDLNDFRTALGNFRTINQNFIYADTDGNIGMFSGGGIPLRKNNGLLIRDGATDEYDWTGYLPPDRQPFTYNPENGYVSSANNKTVNNDYPYFISSVFAAPYRINRIRELLEQKEKFSMDDFKTIINDQHSDCAAHFVPYILDLKKRTSELTEKEIEVLSLFSTWDYDMGKELICPSVFEYFRLSLLENILEDELGELFGELPSHIADNYLHFLADAGNDRFVDDVKTGAKESLDDIILFSFRDCIKQMERIYGKDMNKWVWGNIHTLTVIHPLGTSRILNFFYRFNSEKYGVGGGDHTINMFRSLDPGFEVDAGPSVKNIFNPADWDDSYTILPTGESGITKSEFYLSQTRTFLEGGFYKDSFTDEAVKKAAKYTLTMKPGK